MTIKQKVVALRKQFPDESWRALGERVGLNRHTVRGYVDPGYQKQRRKLVADNLRERIKKHKFILVQFLGGQCSECGYRGCDAALEFHHKDPATKIGRGVSDVLTGRFELALEEAKKCVLLCGNCHQKLHETENENNLSIEQSAGIQGVGKTGEGAGPQTLRLNPN